MAVYKVGMHPYVILLANMRLAPVQVASYGHSSSSHGALVDYFIGGAEVELWNANHPVSGLVPSFLAQSITPPVL